MMDVNMTSHADEVKEAMNRAMENALEIIGIKAEGYAKRLCPVGTEESTGKKGYRGGTLRNSITHVVEGDSVSIGTNVEYAPFVELGTGPYFEPPPEWEQFEPYESQGVGTGYVRPRKFLQPAITDHRDEYKEILRSEMGDK